METQTGSFEYTRQVLKKLEMQARREIERLGGNKGLTMFLDKMREGVEEGKKNEGKKNGI